MEAIARNVLGPLAVKILAANPPFPFSVGIDASNKRNRKFFPLAVSRLIQ